MLRDMASVMTRAAASAVVALDRLEQATLTELARATMRPLSGVQRTVDGLLAADVLERGTPRGPVRFSRGAPRAALRDLAEWTLRRKDMDRVEGGLRTISSGDWTVAPSTVHDQRIRDAWPQVIRSLEEECRPAKVILFGSQARGDAGPESDVDLLVVFTENVNRRERRVEILRLLRDAPFAKDVLVATTADVANPLIGSALADAVREGVTVYER